MDFSVAADAGAASDDFTMDVVVRRKVRGLLTEVGSGVLGTPETGVAGRDMDKGVPTRGASVDIVLTASFPAVGAAMDLIVDRSIF